MSLNYQNVRISPYAGAVLLYIISGYNRFFRISITLTSDIYIAADTFEIPLAFGRVREYIALLINSSDPQNL